MTTQFGSSTHRTAIGSFHHAPDTVLDADCAILVQSGLFDERFYRNLARLDPGSNAVEHYLVTGWRCGMEPCADFDGAFLYPYFKSVGLDGPPAITFLNFQAAGWPVYPTRAAAEAIADAIRDSEWFDAAGYARRAGCDGLDPALHYVLVGEPLGHSPSERFDPVYYRTRYDDIRRAGISPLGHFVMGGRAEQRQAISVAGRLTFDTRALDPARETVLLIVHQASRTGAPILAYNIALRLRRRYNVVSLLLTGGDLVADFQHCSTVTIGPLTYADWRPVEMEYLVRRLVGTYRFAYALANTIDSRLMLKPLTLAMIPVVALVHEFSSYLSKGEMGAALEWATEVVFSAPSVASSAIADYPDLGNRAVHVFPQGQSKLPPATIEIQREEEERLATALRPRGAEDALLVLGCGTIFLRKGVDLFLSCATKVASLGPRRPVRFVWIGAQIPPNVDGGYFALLKEQVERAGLGDSFALVDEVANLAPAFAAADLFFLSSRLDPLPNVAIDAAMQGTPVICFEQSGGMADLLASEFDTQGSVVPYLDVHAAAKLVARLADDPSALAELGAATRRLAEKTFDMNRYVDQLDTLGRDAARLMEQRAHDLATISGDPMFDAINFLGTDVATTSREEAIRRFIARSAILGATVRPKSNFYYRRPCAGFHPQIYAHENLGRDDSRLINPLAQFIRAGKPDGPWKTEVIDLSSSHIIPQRESKVALHGHFFYVDLFADCLAKLQINRTQCDLLLSAANQAGADQLQEMTRQYNRGRVVVRVVPNRGRDIGPFLTEFRAELQDYDLVGHVHSKRSLHAADPVLGETWREFMWQNLLGGLYPAMDIIVDTFLKDEGLGIVFPDDPHLSGWDSNRDIAESLAVRMGMQEPLPPFFNFPIGTMFWARPRALEPLWSLGFGLEDYPEEPIGIDGTVLHAVERLLPFAARQAGFRYATTHIPGLTW